MNFSRKSGILVTEAKKLMEGNRMIKYTALILVLLTAAVNCMADTFVNRSTGRTFNGYIVQIQKGGKTQVRIEGKRPEYIDPGAYEIRHNRLGRKKTVYVFSLKESLDLMIEVEAFEKAVVSAANQGPLFILIDIDSSGGKGDVVERFCTAISRINNCQTVAYIGDGRFGGAYSAAAMVALSCDKVYMREGAFIGSEEPLAGQRLRGGQTEVDYSYYEQLQSQLQPCISMVIEQNKRPGLLINAMFDKDIEVLEIREREVRSLIDKRNRKSSQAIVRTMSKAGSLLK